MCEVRGDSTTQEIDVCSLVLARHHGKILQLIDEVAFGTSCVLVNDHDTKPRLLSARSRVPEAVFLELCRERSDSLACRDWPAWEGGLAPRPDIKWRQGAGRHPTRAPMIVLREIATQRLDRIELRERLLRRWLDGANKDQRPETVVGIGSSCNKACDLTGIASDAGGVPTASPSREVSLPQITKMAYPVSYGTTTACVFQGTGRMRRQAASRLNENVVSGKFD